MRKTAEAVPAFQPHQAAWADLTRVCAGVPPLWDLADYVAVNPFVGFSSCSLVEAAREIADGLGAEVLPPIEFYREQWRAGTFGSSDLEQAARYTGYNSNTLEAIVSGAALAPARPAMLIRTCAEQHDQRFGTSWSVAINRHFTRWCAVYVARGNPRWRLPAEERGFYIAWREAAQADLSLEIAGIRGWRAWVRGLPDDPREALATVLERLHLSEHHRRAYFSRLLGGVFGWAAYMRRGSWQAGDRAPEELAELLVARVCADAAVAHLAEVVEPSAVTSSVVDEAVRAIFQEALENAYARRLLGAIVQPPPDAPATRPSFQAVFCIDVRSEVLRRHLEAQDAAIETRGFAGFFGVSLDWVADGASSARCPVLLSPGVRLHQAELSTPAVAATLFKDLPLVPAAAYTFVETLGLVYGLGLAGDALMMRSTPRVDEGRLAFVLDPDQRGGGVPFEARLNLAQGILKNMGLRDSFARLVLLCGHESRSENNPHAAGLECGACGGHSGALNARVAAALLNDPAVRAGLAAQGWHVPGDTHFVPGVHNTATDEVTLLDTDRLPPGHAADLARLEQLLAQAGALTRAERAPSLGLDARRPGLLNRLLRRARDWSEVRPEWALARNAAFIAARRARTRGVNLEGRAFLHEYDWRGDPDASILGLILSAPVVVATWINLQYFASTIDNRMFGCGTKALHNRVGTLGVVLGNGGDLRTGLAAQSVYASDGRWYHEPLRLQVMVEAPHERIDAALAAHPQVRELIDNGWIRLFALDPEREAAAHWWPGRGWEPVALPATPADLQPQIA